jgi:hypothetical protein
MSNPPLKDPKGGLTAAGRKEFGGNLKPGVKDYTKASTADKKRWISWALRFYGQKDYPPLVDEKGEPTRFALTAAAWGEPVPKKEADGRAIAAKAKKRQEELNRSMAQGEVFAAGVTEDIIEHFGVKGMKWGVRKAPDKSRSASNWKARKDKERAAKEKTKSSSSKPSAKKMTDDELKSAIARMQLEKQYSQLVRETVPLTKGQAFTRASKDILVQVTKEVAKEATKAVVKNEVQKRLNIPVGNSGKEAAKNVVNETKNAVKDAKKATKKAKSEISKEDIIKVNKDRQRIEKLSKSIKPKK